MRKGSTTRIIDSEIIPKLRTMSKSMIATCEQVWKDVVNVLTVTILQLRLNKENFQCVGRRERGGDHSTQECSDRMYKHLAHDYSMWEERERKRREGVELLLFLD